MLSSEATCLAMHAAVTAPVSTIETWLVVEETTKVTSFNT